jgi:hypothetical protein
MAPGPLTNAHRGGFGFNHNRGNAFYPGRRLAASYTPGRAFSGTRERFSVAPNADTGGHDIALGDNEVAVVSVDDDGKVKIEISNKPPAEEPAPAEGEAAYRSAKRGNQIDKMSWTKNPDGTVTFIPDDSETLNVSGDAMQAVVSALPTTQP